MFLPEYKYFMRAANLNHMNNHAKAFMGERWWDERKIKLADVEVKVRYTDRIFMGGFISTMTVENNNFKLTYRIFDTSAFSLYHPTGRFVKYKNKHGANDLMIVCLALPQ